MALSTYVRGTLVAALAAALFFGSGVFSASAQEGSRADRDGFRALSGEQAREYEVPDDLREVHSSTDPEGLTQTRYQQYVGEAAVQGGQVTVLSEDGEQVAVTGSYYPDVEPANDVKLSKGQARAVVKRQRGQKGRFPAQLLIDPQTGRQFYEVDSQRFGSRVVFYIDADTGREIRQYDNLQDAAETGIGVKGDTKLLDTSRIRQRGGVSALISSDGRQKTEDGRNKKTLEAGKLFTDEDGAWTDQGRTSPGQAAGVDAHYYANVTDDYYQDIHGRNSLDDEGMTMLSSAHYTEDYNNAFWNGRQMVYGDGDGEVFRELSGGLDVVSHELTHGVTDYTSDLIYMDESGALNEAFSDMMANTTEFYAAERGLDPAAEPDWGIGEDVYLGQTEVPGFRNMADPAEDGQPDHYSELYTGEEDNGGVHTNSGIPNHAYYLLVEGGSNAGEARGHDHSGPEVEGIGLEKAEQIFYKAFTSLPSNATMSEARLTTEAMAIALYGADSAELQSVSDAWEAVGVR